jgi:mRNA interferase RelE/StbE
MYNLRFRPLALKVYLKITGTEFERIDKALEQLQGNPRPHGVKKIRENIHRMRVGNWRIIYTINDRENIVIVGKIARRSEDTYNNVGDLF